jgi:hypothetical protein
MEKSIEIAKAGVKKSSTMREICGGNMSFASAFKIIVSICLKLLLT